ncbi:hypothetical protein HGG76_20865 [Ochrobactrum tritici]|uniref:Uncharacterized protein n=1 Tax=Brucella tritici TaxID=94626 RepID=A0A7X6JCL9_9HYPH|nr:hypothetical protein [Brucella tritici]
MQSDYRVLREKDAKGRYERLGSEEGCYQTRQRNQNALPIQGATIEDLCIFGGEGRRLFRLVTKRTDRRIQAIETERQRKINEASKGISLKAVEKRLADL